MKYSRQELELTIAASLVVAGEHEAPRFIPEISDLKPEDFSDPLYREIYQRFVDGTIDGVICSVKQTRLFINNFTIAGNIRWYCLELLMLGDATNDK